MMVNIPQPELYQDWKAWAEKLVQELQGMLDTVPIEQGVDGVFTSQDGLTIEVRAGIVVSVKS